MRLTSLTLMCAALLTISACGGGGAKMETHNTTMGQELVDLKKAYDEGIITEREYKRAKNDIIDMYDN